MARRQSDTEQVAQATPSLRISALGPLKICKGGVEIPSNAWARQKSRTLFAFLLCARPGRVHKEELIEFLWPGAGPSRGSHTLQVALSDLRATLAKGGPRHEGRCFIRRLGDHYGLDVGPSGWVDAEAFATEHEAGREADMRGERATALRHLQAAEQLWTGDFLTEERFAEWADTRRQTLRDQYLDSLQRLVRLYEAVGQLESAVATTKKLLSVDPYLEPYYRDLMRYLRILGDHGGVVRTYLRCERAMREGFDTDVSPETRRLVEMFLGSPVDAILRRHAAAERRFTPKLARPEIAPSVAMGSPALLRGTAAGRPQQ